MNGFGRLRSEYLCLIVKSFSWLGRFPAELGSFLITATALFRAWPGCKSAPGPCFDRRLRVQGPTTDSNGPSPAGGRCHGTREPGPPESVMPSPSAIPRPLVKGSPTGQLRAALQGFLYQISSSSQAAVWWRPCCHPFVQPVEFLTRWLTN